MRISPDEEDRVKIILEFAIGEGGQPTLTLEQVVRYCRVRYTRSLVRDRKIWKAVIHRLTPPLMEQGFEELDTPSGPCEERLWLPIELF